MYRLLFVLFELLFMKTLTQGSTRQARTFWAVLAIASAIDVGATWLLGRSGYPSYARMLFALLPIPANLVLLAMIVRRIRRLDEFLRHVHLEGAAIGFLLTALAVFIYADLQNANYVGPLNVGVAWLLMALFYGIGYVIASRHYR
jgi:hypothetical protein